MVRLVCLSCTTELQLRSVVHKIADLMHLPRASGAWHKLRPSWRARVSDGSLKLGDLSSHLLGKGWPAPPTLCLTETESGWTRESLRLTSLHVFGGSYVLSQSLLRTHYQNTHISPYVF